MKTEEMCSEENGNTEILKVTLSAIFIATYTGLIFAIPQVPKINPNSLIGVFFYIAKRGSRSGKMDIYKGSIRMVE
jgi:hypothetical protein